MGIVIFCEDKEDARPVALKTYKPELLARRASRLCFLEEAANWIYLGAHPNIVQAFRVEQMGNPPRPYIVMERIKSAHENGAVALSEYLRHPELSPFTPKKALQTALEIARGMHHAVDRIKELVHRDLKPGNILIDDKGIARVSDFGLLWTLTDAEIKQRQTILSQLEDSDYNPAGSLAYIAPEAWQRMNTIDCRADIYAVGLILIEMLTAERAVNSRDKVLVEQAHCKGDLPKLDSSVPAVVRELVKKSTALDKNDRYADWPSFEAAIEAAYEQITGVASEPLPECDLAIDRLGNAHSYVSIGASFLDLGYAEISGPYLIRALEIAEELSDIPLQVKARLSLARVREYEGRTREAIDLLNGGSEIVQNNADNRAYNDIQAMMGNLYARQGKFDQAIDILDSALAQAQARTDEESEILLLGSIANTYAEKKSFARAILYYRSQLGRLRVRSDALNTATCLANLGAAYLDANQPQVALDYLLEASKLSESVGDLGGRLRAVKLLCEVNRALNDQVPLCVNANLYLKLCVEINDHDEISWAEELIRESCCDDKT